MFARVLNVKPKLVSEWERGEKKPSGPSLKLLSIVKARGLEAIIWLQKVYLLQRHSMELRSAICNFG